MSNKYFIVDVFTSVKFEGAQIAVFPHADDMADAEMQMLARELNLSETVFICAVIDAESDFRLRIFSPLEELRFAGHPLLAAGYVLHHSGLTSKSVIQLQLNDDVVRLAIETIKGETKIQFTVKSTYHVDEFVPPNKELGDILHLDEKVIGQSDLRPMLVSCRGDYLVVPVKTIDAFNTARFSIDKWTTSFVATLASQICVCCKVAEVDGAVYRLRLLGKHITEGSDPPVGSAAPAIAVYLFGAKAAGLYNAVMQRGGDGRRKSLINITVEKTEDVITAIQVGGYAVQTGSGVIDSV